MKTSNSEVSVRANAREARVKADRPAEIKAQQTFQLDGEDIFFTPGQTIMQAATDDVLHQAANDSCLRSTQGRNKAPAASGLEGK